MSTKTLQPSRLIQTVRSLLEHFEGRLCGARQATRKQLVHYLAKNLAIDEPTAERLFDDLREAGVILRGDEPLDEAQFAAPNQQSWTVNSEVSPEAVSDAASTVRAADRKDGPPVVDLVRRAISERATDIHLDPFEDEIEVRFRIDGQLEHFCRLSHDVGEQLMSQLKVMGDIDPAGIIQPAESRLKLPFSLSQLDARITVTRVVSGEAIAIRLMHREQILRPLDSLGLTEWACESLRKSLCAGEGLILIAGPSGAGKSTTAYSLASHLDDGSKNIVTIEDPVEYFVPGFLQMPVDLEHAFDFAAGLRTALRMDPDIVLLSEVRDEPTGQAVMRAASSGKHVISTFHARDAASVVTGLRDLKIDDRSLSCNLSAIIAQRLVRRLCSTCKEYRDLSEAERLLFETEGVQPPETVGCAVGCDACGERGFRDRIGVFEIAPVDEELATAVQFQHCEKDIRMLLRGSGVPSLLCDGLQKVAAGITTIDEIMGMSCMPLQTGKTDR